MYTLFLYMPFKILTLLVSDRWHPRMELGSESEECALIEKEKNEFDWKDKFPKCMKPWQLHYTVLLFQ